MKHILRVLALCLLLALPACALASGLTSCYWQLEAVEVENHPWFVGVQYHPEYKSTVLSPSPLFVAFVKAALAYAEKK